MNSTTKRICTALVLASALLGAGCGDDDDGDAPAAVTAPPGGGPSSKYGVPLPEGATAEPDAGQPATEVYRLADDVSEAEADAFFTAETDGKPLQGFEWCGRVLAGRIWHRPAANPRQEDVLEIAVDGTSAEAVLVRISQRTSPPLTCPPEPPEGTS